MAIIAESHYPDEQEVAPTDSEHVAEDEAEQVHRIVALPAHDHDAQGEGADEQNADGRVQADPRPPLYEADRQGGSDRGYHRPQIDALAQDERCCYAGERGVRQRVADERQPLYHHKRSDHGADGAHHQHRQERPLHELVLKGLGKPVPEINHGRDAPRSTPFLQGEG